MVFEHRKSVIIPVTGILFLEDKPRDTIKAAIFNVDDIIDIAASQTAI